MHTTQNLLAHIARDEVNPVLRARYIKNRNSDPTDEFVRAATILDAANDTNYAPTIWPMIVGILIAVLMIARGFIGDISDVGAFFRGLIFLLILAGAIYIAIDAGMSYFKWREVKKSGLDVRNEFLTKISFISKVLGMKLPQLAKLGKKELSARSRERLIEYRKHLTEKEKATADARVNLPDGEAAYTSCLEAEGVARACFEEAHRILTEFGLIEEDYEAFDPKPESEPAPATPALAATA